MADNKYILIGRSLDSTELANFPAKHKFSLADTVAWRSTKPTDLLEENESLHHLDRLSLLLMTSVTLQCPVGPHDDPGLASAVLCACSISKVGSVAVQCSQGHWAAYPCG
jgi:hypothetical protein